MANQLGSLTVTPRSYVQHLRHGAKARVRHAHQFTAFLAAQATRLSSTAATVFAKLKKYPAQEVKAAASLSDLP
jgi:hypothetical protein